MNTFCTDVKPAHAAGQGIAQDRAPTAVIHVVDDEPGMRSALQCLLEFDGFRVRTHASAEEFLAAHDPYAFGCILLDLAMPGLGGLGLQARLASTDTCLPIVFLTGLADVSLCTAAMRAGAVDYLTKPVDEDRLLRAITRALACCARNRAARQRHLIVANRLASLTRREHEVLVQVMDGRLNKQIAGDLGTAEKTVKVHRARAMEKMNVRTVAELVRMVERSRWPLRTGDEVDA